MTKYFPCDIIKHSHYLTDATLDSIKNDVNSLGNVGSSNDKMEIPDDPESDGEAKDSLSDDGSAFFPLLNFLYVTNNFKGTSINRHFKIRVKFVRFLIKYAI